MTALPQPMPATRPDAPDDAGAVAMRQASQGGEKGEKGEAGLTDNAALQTREARAVAIKNIASRSRTVGRNATNDADSVPSPCISLCRVDANTQWCDGCFRTIDEISQWSRLDAAGKRRVWQTIGQRAGQVGAALAARPL